MAPPPSPGTYRIKRRRLVQFDWGKNLCYTRSSGQRLQAKGFFAHRYLIILKKSFLTRFRHSRESGNLYMTTQLIAHAGRGGFETRPYRPTLTGMSAIVMRIF